MPEVYIPQPGEVCDFCGSGQFLVATLRCRPFVVFNLNGERLTDDGEWVVCAHCLPLVDAKDLKGLLDRCFSRRPIPPSLTPIEVIRQDIAILISAFLMCRLC